MRHDNWQAELSSYISALADTPFDIVELNCLKFACGAIKAQTDKDFYEPLEDRFKTIKGAVSTLRNVGKAETVSDFFEARLGDRKPLAFIRKGDIVVNCADEPLGDLALFGPAVGVCYGSVCYFVGETGLVSLQTMRLGSDSYGFHC